MYPKHSTMSSSLGDHCINGHLGLRVWHCLVVWCSVVVVTKLRMTQLELDKIVRLHGLWLKGDLAGVRANLAGTNLSCTILAGTNLASADLSGTDLSGTNLAGTNLAGTNLTGANLTGADLTGADLTGAVLTDADLSDADLSGANLSCANLYGAYLIYANLSGAYLSRANLSHANLYGADLAGANLSRANLAGADLSDANLTGADLSGANLTGADLSGAVLSGACLSGVVLGGVEVPVIPNIHQVVAAAVNNDLSKFGMASWHSECGTAHCRGGWVITLAGDLGRKLETEIGTSAAAAFIYTKSDPNLGGVPDFHVTNNEALADINHLAGLT
jgi:uncharacterized protein YjbI with pentapeptide repeats